MFAHWSAPNRSWLSLRISPAGFLQDTVHRTDKVEELQTLRTHLFRAGSKGEPLWAIKWIRDDFHKSEVDRNNLSRSYRKEERKRIWTMVRGSGRSSTLALQHNQTIERVSPRTWEAKGSKDTSGWGGGDKVRLGIENTFIYLPFLIIKEFRFAERLVSKWGKKRKKLIVPTATTGIMISAEWAPEQRQQKLSERENAIENFYYRLTLTVLLLI